MSTVFSAPSSLVRHHRPIVRLTAPNAFTLLLLALTAANYDAPLADLDFTWQIRTGELIVRTGDPRPPESFTYTIAGQRVPEFEWLYEVLVYAVWSTLGFGGLKLLKTILVATPLILVALRLRRGGVRWPGIALALFFAIVVLSPVWNLRPLYCTTIGLLLVSGWLHDHCTGQRPLSWRLPIVMLLWANLHPGVITGQGLVAGAIGWEWLNRAWHWNPPLDRSACWRLTVIGGLGLAATFVSPAPLERLLYPFRSEVAHPIQRIFVEMQHLHVFLWQTPYSAWWVYTLAALVTVTVVLRFRVYRFWEVLLLLGLAGLANLAVRSMQDWVLVMMAVGGPHLAALLRAWRRSIVNARKARADQEAAFLAGWQRSARWYGTLQSARHAFLRPLFRFQPGWLFFIFLLVLVVSLSPPLSRRWATREGKDWPTAALDWAVAHELHGNFFGVPDYGSYVTWRLGDRAKCYVDTRGFFFPHELIEDSHQVPLVEEGWQARLNRIMDYDTEYFLLEASGPRGRLWETLQPHIRAPLYLDDKTVLLTRVQVENALAAEKRSGLLVNGR